MSKLKFLPSSVFSARPPHWIRLLAVVFFVGAVFGVSSVALASSGETSASDRLVTIFDNGQEKTIVTNATTVAGALDQADITVESVDAVEPTLDTELIASSYSVNVYRARPVVVIDSARQIRVITAAQSSADIARAANLTIYPEDKTTISRTEDVLASGGAGLTMTIDRATPINLILYGKASTVRTHTSTARELLREKSIKLSLNDTISVDLDALIKADMTIEVWRNGKQTITVDEEIPFDTEQIKDADHEVGYRQVQMPGTKGKKSVTYEVEMKNGQEISRREIASIAIDAPKKQVEIVGTKMTNSFSGSFAEALARLRSCEGSYTSNTGNGYYGAYQFDLRTWGNYKGYPNAAAAPPAVQDEKAWETYMRRGWQPWPACSRKLGLQDIYR